MRRARYRAAAVALTLLVGYLISAPVVSADVSPTLTLSEINSGNVFVDGQQVTVGLSTDASSVTWWAADVNGTTVASGTAPAAGTLNVGVTVRGWYQLTVQAAQGTAVTTARTTFAILSQRSTAPLAGLGASVLGNFESSAEGWTFYPGSEYPGATGSFTLDATTAHTGSASGLLAGNFAAGGAYVSVNRSVPAVNATSLSFWVRTSTLSWLNVRLTDATGQVHQQRLMLSGTTDWQSLAVTRFDGGINYLYWGGANDGVWHGPAQAVELVLDKGGIIGAATSASVDLDDVTAGYPAAQPSVMFGDYESSAEAWSFYPGSEYPGATGGFTLDTTTAHTGSASGLLSGNFSGGGAYVAVQQSFTPVNLTGLSLWVRTSQLSAIGLRLTDATGQVHQQQLVLSGSTDWQELTVTRFDAGTGYLHFGGADDGIWHEPAQAMELTLDRGQIAGGATSASVNIDAVVGSYAGSLIGASTHFGQAWSTDLVPLMSQAGLGGGRDEAYWSDIETAPGTYTYPAKVTSYLQAWQSNDLDPLLIADYSNPNYDGGSAPYDDTGRTAFANYADALVGHFPQIHNLAVWNEWDLNTSGPADPGSYVALLKATYSKVKADHPTTMVVGGGDVDVNQLDWFQSFCAAGGLPYLDAVSIHPYNYLGAPEGLGAAIEQVRALIRQYNNGIDKPIWITEDGWPTGTGTGAVSEPAQAQYLVRAQLVARAHSVQRFYDYDFMNDGTDPTNTQHNYGLVHNSADALGGYTPKPSYVAYAVAARQLSGATFLGQENPGNGLYDEVFAAADGSPLRVIWAGSGANTTVTVTSAGPVQVTSLYGLPSTFYPDVNGHVSVVVGTWPTYVSGSAITAVSAP